MDLNCWRGLGGCPLGVGKEPQSDMNKAAGNLSPKKEHIGLGGSAVFNPEMGTKRFM